VILRTGWLCHAEYEWSRHTILAKQVGLTEQEIQRITEDLTTLGWSLFEITLLQAVDELHARALPKAS
jgi:hypothetical protein